MTPQSRVFVAGHQGMVGSAIVRRLQSKGYVNLITAERQVLDLTSREAVAEFIKHNNPEVVIVAAAKVGGIEANRSQPVEFLLRNLQIQCNVMESAHLHGVQQLLFLGSSCIYPRDASQPIKESALLCGPLETTNEPYAVAKIAGIKLCESYHRQYGRDYRCVMPTNLYGPGDNFHPEHSHVVPALLRRFHEAALRGDEAVTVWGSGLVRREFMHVDDMAAASVHVMELDEQQYWQGSDVSLSHINVGTGTDCTVRELAETVAEVTGFRGHITWDKNRPEGTPRKLLDISLLTSLGWRATISLRDGLTQTLEWYVHHPQTRRM